MNIEGFCFLNALPVHHNSQGLETIYCAEIFLHSTFVDMEFSGTVFYHILSVIFLISTTLLIEYIFMSCTPDFHLK